MGHRIISPDAVPMVPCSFGSRFPERRCALRGSEGDGRGKS